MRVQKKTRDARCESPWAISGNARVYERRYIIFPSFSFKVHLALSEIFLRRCVEFQYLSLSRDTEANFLTLPTGLYGF